MSQEIKLSSLIVLRLPSLALVVQVRRVVTTETTYLSLLGLLLGCQERIHHQAHCPAL